MWLSRNSEIALTFLNRRQSFSNAYSLCVHDLEGFSLLILAQAHSHIHR